MRPVGEAMSRHEILELMRLKGWNQAELSRQLEISEAAVSRWLRDQQNPTGPARKLMRLLLAQAREGTAAQPA